MSNEKFGIEKLKEALTFAINMTESIQNRFDDGSFSLWDGLSLVPMATNVRKYINNGSQIRKEFNDLSPQERKDLKIHIQNELDLEDDYIESIIERSLTLLESIGNLVDVINKERTGK